MSANGFVTNLISFLKTARHLWGRCPSCGTPFRLSDAAISSSPEPPKDWLRRLQKQQERLDDWEGELGLRKSDLDNREDTVADRERDVRDGEYRLERDAKKRVQEILRSKTEVQALIRTANREAVKRSRATLLGKMLERVAPCFRKFYYDPRDMRSICDPVDYVLFDGLTIDRRVDHIRFIEVKCGTSRVTPAQRSVREAVEKRRIEMEVWQIGDPRIPITKQLSSSERALLEARE